MSAFALWCQPSNLFNDRSMYLSRFTLYHAEKAHKAACASLELASNDALALETCLRRIAILPAPLKASHLDEGVEIYQGEDAYRFLLEVTCGLKSAIKAEPEIFSQFKRSWEDYQEGGRHVTILRPVIQAIFQDTKRIRTQYLEGLGGVSYYSATEKLIGLDKDDTVLLIGAGQFGCMLANSMIKRVKKLIIANRSDNGMEHVKAKLGTLGDRLEIVSLEEAIATQIALADHVLVSIPAGKDQALDQSMIAAWKARLTNNDKGFLLHYGEESSTHAEWRDLPRSLTLSDVMQCQSTYTAKQQCYVAQALEACATLAVERTKKSSEHLAKHETAAICPLYRVSWFYNQC